MKDDNKKRKKCKCHIYGVMCPRHDGFDMGEVNKKQSYKKEEMFIDGWTQMFEKEECKHRYVKSCCFHFCVHCTEEKPDTEGWEEKIEKILSSTYEIGVGPRKEKAIKELISHELSKQRQELIERIEGRKLPLDFTASKEEIDAHNNAIDDVLQAIKEKP